MERYFNKKFIYLKTVYVYHTIMYRKKQVKTKNEQDEESYSNYDSNHDYDEERTVFIKEFDLNEMPPNSAEDNNGVKLVVIGKPGCFAPGTEVLMFDGSIKKIEDVKIGDQVMGDDGETPRTVQQLYHDEDEMFEICNGRGGESYTVNRLHDLVLVASRDHGKQHKKGDVIEISVEEYLKQNNAWKHTFKTFRSTGIKSWKDNELKIDPYFLGVWLGDGTSCTLNITNVDNEILGFCKSYSESLGLKWNKLSKEYCYSITSKEETKGKNQLLNYFHVYKLLNNKHVPCSYKISSEESRLKLLAGLIDTDGWYDKKCKYYEIIQKNETLSRDIVFISKSLGIATTIRKVKKSCMYNGEKREGDYYRINLFGSNISRIPCLVERKKVTEELSSFKNRLRSSFEVIKKGRGEYFGFELDNNRRFCLANFEIVKNTGKSSIISSIVDSKKHIIPVSQIFSGTEDSNGFYCSKFPSITVFNDVKDLKPIESFVTRQKYSKRYLYNPWAVQIIDDCTDDPKLFTKPLFQSYYKNGRHWKMLHILSLQYCLDIKPVIRTNIDYTFILRETNKKNRKSLFENYASCVDNLRDFESLLDQLTTDYCSMVVVNRSQSNNIEDCVRWYKADLEKIKNFKFGSDDFWLFNNQRLEENYVDTYSI
jgi:hypothetical protein